MLLPVHLLSSGLGPEYPLLPLPEYPPLVLQLPSPQIFPLVRSSSNTTSPLKLSLILKLNWIPQISVPNPEYSDSIEHILPWDTAHKSEKLRCSRQPSQRCTQPCQPRLEEQNSTKSQEKQRAKRELRKGDTKITTKIERTQRWRKGQREAWEDQERHS